ncbi:MAG: N-formylglutamate amidohydrolase [Alphaproteobacteria bacterium]
MATQDIPETGGSGGESAPIDIARPERQAAPVVFASPHSGAAYPPDFVASSPLDLLSLRRSEDCFVDALFAAAPEHGMPLLRALFPRAFIDPNREPFELDPDMFEDELPSYANTRSTRVQAGLGTIARVVSSGQEIYAGKLRFADAARRINAHYRPYHRALRELLDATRQSFGCYVLIDCHSMPSVGGPYDPDAGKRRPDVILGDCFGASCNDLVIAEAELAFRACGYKVVRNKPFAGGFSARHYGRPAQGMHSLQIELNRALYMDEALIRPTDGLVRLTEDITQVIAALARLNPARLRAG